MSIEPANVIEIHSPEARLADLKAVAGASLLADPMTVIAVIAAVVEIANGVADAALKFKTLFSGGADQQEVMSLLKAVNFKLDELLRGQAEILEQIKDLRFVIREEVTQSEVRQLHISVQGWIFTLNQNIIKLESSSDEGRIRIKERLEDLLFGAAGAQLFAPTFWGPGAFSTVAISYSAWVQMVFLTDQPGDIKLSGLNRFSDAFAEAKRNAQESIKFIENEIDLIKVSIDRALGNRKMLVHQNVDQFCKYGTPIGKNVTLHYMQIRGSLESGFYGEMTTERGQWNLTCIRDEIPTLFPDGNEDNAYERLCAPLNKYDTIMALASVDHEGVISFLNQRRTDLMSLEVKREAIIMINEEIGRLIDSVEILRDSSV